MDEAWTCKQIAAIGPRGEVHFAATLKLELHRLFAARPKDDGTTGRACKSDLAIVFDTLKTALKYANL